MIKKTFLIILIAVLYISLTLSFFNFVSGEDITSNKISSKDILSYKGISGIKIINFSIDGNNTDKLIKNTTDYKFETTYTKDGSGIKQDIYLTNLKADKTFSLATLLEIDYDKIKWNGISYNLASYTKSNPLRLFLIQDKNNGGTGAIITLSSIVGGEIKGLTITNSGEGYSAGDKITINGKTGGTGAIIYVDKVGLNGEITAIKITSGGTGYTYSDEVFVGNTLTPSIFFDDIFNKKIDYTDITDMGGYALLYSDLGKNYIELKIDSILLVKDALTKVDPVYYNQSDGFSITSAGDGTSAQGIYYNNSNFWVVSYPASTGGVVYSFDKNGANSTFSFFTNNTASTNLNPVGLWSNGSIFFITNNVFDNIYRYNHTDGKYLSLVSTIGFGSNRAYGITGNLSSVGGTNLWFIDDTDNFVYQVRRNNSATWFNQTGFDPTPSGAGDAKYITTTDGKNFWIIDSHDNFVYHLYVIGDVVTNKSDGFSLSQFGINSAGGITTNSTSGNYPKDFWITDSSDLFVYHIGLEYEVEIVYPSNNSFHKINNINVNYTNINSFASNCWYSNDSFSANTTLATCGTNITGITWSEGAHNVRIWTNSSAGELLTSSIYFTIDTVNPIVSLVSPLNNTLSNLVAQIFTGNITDTILSGLALHIWDYLGNELTPTGLCYQEFANKSTSCGGLNTGTYSNKDGNFESGSNLISYSYDGDWGTAISQDSTGNGSIYINYTKPFNAKNSSIWQIMHGSTGSPINASLNIPSSCWNFSAQTISLKLTSWNFATAGNISTYCYNGTWNLITNSSTDNLIFEEAIWWDLSGNATALTGTSNQTSWTYNLSDGNYTWNIEGFDYLGHSNWSTLGNYTLRIDTTNPTINLTSPYNINYATNTYLNLNLNFTYYDANLGYCYYKIINTSGTGIIIGNTSLPNCQNITFNLSNYDGNYNLTVYVNDTFGNINSSSVSFGVRVNSPSVNLNYPADNQFFNHSESIYFNFTAFRDIGIDTCELWGNFSGTFSLNYTWVNPTNNTMNFTIQNLTEGNFIWNIKCNDTLNNLGWALNNFTTTIDTIYPDVSINSITTSPGYLTIILNSSTNDTNQDYCRYTVFNSLGAVDGALNNTFTCNSLISLTVSSYATYNLTVYSFDKANNLNQSTNQFIINPPSPIQPGGGGNTPVVPIVSKTFCGDGIQQTPNDYGLIEDYWTCSQDVPGAVGSNLDDLFESIFVFCFDNNPDTICGLSSIFSILYSTQGIEGNFTTSNVPFNLDTAGLNCFSSEKASECYWNTKKGGAVFLIGFIIIFLILTVKVIPTKGSKNRTSVPRYIIYQAKNAKRKKHR